MHREVSVTFSLSGGRGPDPVNKHRPSIHHVIALQPSRVSVVSVEFWNTFHRYAQHLPLHGLLPSWTP